MPWGVWLQPLLFWFLFILNIYFVTLCLLVILRRQWVERERLLFPLAILPVEMTDTPHQGLIPRFFRNPLTWLGFCIPTAVNSINALHAYYNFVPAIDLNARLFFLRNAFSFELTPRFEVIGLSYLLSLDVSFGVWLFAFLFHIQTAVERLLGWTIGPTQPFSDPAPPTVAHMGLGALLVLVLSGFYFGRHHLRDVLRKALHGAPDVDDSDEIMSYRVAVIGFVAGSALAVAWLAASGLGLLGASLFFLSALVIFLGLARIISQTGMAYARAPVAAPVFTVNALGAGLLGPAGLTTLGLHFAWSADVRTFVMASAATGMKLAEVTRLETRRLLWAILLAILVTLAGSAWAVIELGYAFGGINLGYWHFVGLPQFAGNWITRNINNPLPPQTWHLAYMGIGATLMAALSWVKARFIGFPVHPVGLALGLTVPIYHVWFSVFIAWAFKAVVLKYGGAILYRRLRPFFLGMTLGAFASAGLWLLIDALTGMTGNRFTVG